ncbi:pyridoxal-phosphate dependent enzyme, partial [Clostridioides difficile]
MQKETGATFLHPFNDKYVIAGQGTISLEIFEQLDNKVAIVFTGGTISMTVDDKVGAAIPTLSGEQILSMVTNIDKVA